MVGLSTVSKIRSFSEKAIDVHCHGIGRFDFTDIPQLDLDEIEELLASRKQHVILTLYLPKPYFDDFLGLTEHFSYGKKLGRFQYIQGFGIEGPLLASHGGTPEEGVWVPEREHWELLSQAGKRGLIYNVLSPDFPLSQRKPPKGAAYNIEWVVETLLKGGVLPAPGHFLKADPKESARCLESVLQIVARVGQIPTMTDHLFNDMPRNFKHVWRTPDERLTRDEDLKALHLENWSLETLDQDVGFVPATMMRAACKGTVKLAVNFDGEHVDLAIVKRVVELLGAENIAVMTDSIESKRLAGRQLHLQPESSLLYQDQGIVAAGSTRMERQIENMFAIGLSEKEIALITESVPKSILVSHEKATHV